jgi:hemoglobin-like flavoprotein
VLIDVIAAAVAAETREQDLAGALCQYHLSYGVEAQHFQSAGKALVRMLEEELGDRFFSELGDAWIAACERVGQTILETPHLMAD